jgi:hypothetical protein
VLSKHLVSRWHEETQQISQISRVSSSLVFAVSLTSQVPSPPAFRPLCLVWTQSAVLTSAFSLHRHSCTASGRTWLTQWRRASRRRMSRWGHSGPLLTVLATVSVLAPGPAMPAPACPLQPSPQPSVLGAMGATSLHCSTPAPGPAPHRQTFLLAQPGLLSSRLLMSGPPGLELVGSPFPSGLGAWHLQLPSHPCAGPWAPPWGS